MNAKDLLRHNVELTHSVTKMYLDDIGDEEMLVRPMPEMNHLAWQLGHLIASEHSMLSAVGGTPAPLPDGFAAAHSKETASSDAPAGFRSKAEYMKLMDEMHAATIASIERLSESDLDAPAPEAMRDFFPTVASVMLMLGGHEMMHTGQYVALRRKLGKPIVI